MRILLSVMTLAFALAGCEGPDDPIEIEQSKRIAQCMRERPTDSDAAANCIRIIRYER